LDFTSSVQYTKFSISPEEAILKVFNIDTDKQKLDQKSKFKYTLEDGTQGTEIYGTEQFSESQLVYKSNNPFIGVPPNLSGTNTHLRPSSFH